MTSQRKGTFTPISSKTYRFLSHAAAQAPRRHPGRPITASAAHSRGRRRDGGVGPGVPKLTIRVTLDDARARGRVHAAALAHAAPDQAVGVGHS